MDRFSNNSAGITNIDCADRLFVAAAVGAGDAGDRYRVVGSGVLTHRNVQGRSGDLTVGATLLKAQG